jgi:hypothetical protein
VAHATAPLSWASPADDEAQRLSPKVTFTVPSSVTLTSPLAIQVVEELKTPMKLFDGVPVQFPVVFEAV